MALVIRKDEVEMNINHKGLEDFRWKRSKWLTDMTNAKQIDVGIISLEPNKFSYPYHFHHYAEELFVILSGSAMLRTPDGFQEVIVGDVIFFEMGSTGAHQMYNHTDEPCQYVDLCTDIGLDVCEYPDTGKINVIGPNISELHYKNQEVSYFENEENVRDKWKEANILLK